MEMSYGEMALGCNEVEIWYIAIRATSRMCVGVLVGWMPEWLCGWNATIGVDFERQPPTSSRRTVAVLLVHNEVQQLANYSNEAAKGDRIQSYWTQNNTEK